MPCSSGRTRPCLLHQINALQRACTGRIDAEGYATLVEQAKDFLTGKSRGVQDDLAREMHDASRNDGLRACRNCGTASAR
jgi:excinuclease ABC subunit C